VTQSQSHRRVTPELVAHLPRPGLAIPGNLHYSPDSRFITYLFSERGDLTRELWRADLGTGAREHWLSAPGEAVTEENLSLAEAMRRERQRLIQTGITEYLWAEKANVLLLPLRGELYRWADDNVTRLTGGGIIDPKITADGRRAFFVRESGASPRILPGSPTAWRNTWPRRTSVA
jgi:dipeptidyl-peptidase 4